MAIIAAARLRVSNPQIDKETQENQSAVAFILIKAVNEYLW